jgi:hypothetical protein
MTKRINLSTWKNLERGAEGVGVKVLGAIVRDGALGEEQQVGFDGGIRREHAFR